MRRLCKIPVCIVRLQRIFSSREKKCLVRKSKRRRSWEKSELDGEKKSADANQSRKVLKLIDGATNVKMLISLFPISLGGNKKSKRRVHFFFRTAKKSLESKNAFLHLFILYNFYIRNQRREKLIRI